MQAGALVERLRPRFPDVLEARGDVSVIVQVDDVLRALAYLRDEGDLSFRFLCDVTATDWPDLDPRFWLAYELLSMEHRHRLRVKVGLARADDPPHAPRVTGLDPTAEWLAREGVDFVSA